MLNTCRGRRGLHRLSMTADAVPMAVETGRASSPVAMQAGRAGLCSYCRSVSDFAEDDGGIVAAESESVADSYTHVTLLRRSER